MVRTAQIALLSLFLVSAAVAEDTTTLAYKVYPDLQIVMEVEGTAETLVCGNLPNLQKLHIETKEKRTLLAQQVGGSGGDTLDWKFTGEASSEGTFNGTPRDAQTETLGPVVFTFDERGQVLGTKPEPFDPTPENLMRFRWWRYIAQQLDLPPVLPEEAVAPGAKWDSVVNLTAPDGKPLKGKAEYRFIGTSSEPEGQTAWLRCELAIPFQLRFKPEGGEYNVDGKLRIDRLYAFDIEKGLPRGCKNLAVVDMSIAAKRTEGEEVHLQLVMHAEGNTTMKPKEAGAAEPKAAGAEEPKTPATDAPEKDQ